MQISSFIPLLFLDDGDVAAQHHEQGEQPEEAENEGNVEVVVMMLFVDGGHCR